MITFRQLQRMTVKELLESLPVTVTANGKEILTVNNIGATIKSDSQSVVITKKVTVKAKEVKSSHRPFDICPKHKIYYQSCGE